MAKNFEIIFNLDSPMTLLDGTKKIFTHDEIIDILNSHSCKWIVAKHPIDDLSSFNHYHCGIHTGSDNIYATIGKWFNLPPNSVESIRSKFDSTYALYVKHYNQGSKTPIECKDIETNTDLDYNKLIANIDQKRADDDILDSLARGDISEFELYSTQSEFWCRKHIKDIQNALIVRSKKFAVSQKDREMEVVFIFGNARTGKTYLAEKLCKDQKYSFYKTSNGEHPFDDYMGQDAVILDDLRPSNFKFSELLKILDNHNLSSKVSARYHNIDLNCKAVFITTTLNLDEFYNNIQEHRNEAVTQLRGRIGTLIEVSEMFVNVSALDKDNFRYNPVFRNMPNPILSDERIKKMNDNQRFEVAKKWFKGIADCSNYIADNMQQVKFDDTRDLPFD